jgi:hypothetical protein
MKMRVAVLQGGRSGEHEISLRSARSIMEAMDSGRYDVIPYTIDKEGKWSPRPILPEPGSNPGIDVVFPALHGTFGEDGTVQGLLELADLPYVGAGVLSSSLSMDKELMKRVCSERGLPVVETPLYPALARHHRGAKRLGFRCLWPANLGSQSGFKARPCRAQAAPSWPLSRPKNHSGARDRRPGPSAQFSATINLTPRCLRDPALARVLRLRGQIPARSGQNRARREFLPKRPKSAPSGGRVLPRR